MMPILYSGSNAEPLRYREGVLDEARNDEVHEVLNGKFELSLQYPLSGRLINAILIGRCITANPNPLTDAQIFVIYRITRAINGWITVYARHISYRLRRHVCKPFTAATAAEAVAALGSTGVTETPFSFSTDLEKEGSLAVTVPTPAWTLMGSDEGGILALYGGEWEFDGLRANLLTRRGQDRDATIEYGLNMTDFLSDTMDQELLDGIYAYYLDEDGQIEGEKLVMKDDTESSTGALIEARDYTESIRNTNDINAILQPLFYLEQLAKADLGQNTAVNNGDDTSIRVSFVRLAQVPEFRNVHVQGDVAMGDTVHVRNNLISRYYTRRVTEIRYQPSAERYKEIVLGTATKSVVQTILKK